METGVDKNVSAWFLHDCWYVCKSGEKQEGVGEESGEGSWEKAEHKESLKALENGHSLWPQACREFPSPPGRKAW